MTQLGKLYKKMRSDLGLGRWIGMIYKPIENFSSNLNLKKDPVLSQPLFKTA
jgi:hypothetical protein